MGPYQPSPRQSDNLIPPDGCDEDPQIIAASTRSPAPHPHRLLWGNIYLTLTFLLGLLLGNLLHPPPPPPSPLNLTSADFAWIGYPRYAVPASSVFALPPSALRLYNNSIDRATCTATLHRHYYRLSRLWHPENVHQLAQARMPLLEPWQLDAVNGLLGRAYGGVLKEGCLSVNEAITERMWEEDERGRERERKEGRSWWKVVGGW